jgi:hypothetical protein
MSSLLKSLFGTPLETQVVAEFSAFKNSAAQMIAREDALLRSLGIEPPVMVSDFGFRKKMGEHRCLIFELDPPKFDYPPHRHFIIKRNQHITFVKNLDEFDDRYSLWGLPMVINEETFGDRWTNRDPYAVYRGLEKIEQKTIYYAQPGAFASAVQTETKWFQSQHDPYAERRRLDLLCSVQSLSRAEAADVHVRVRLYNLITAGKHEYLRKPLNYYADHYSAAQSTIPHDILFGLPVAPSWYSEQMISAKILPSGETKPALMMEFLNSLRPLNHYISLELVREGETVFFQLCYPEECGEEIMAKLNLYFPDFEVIELEPPEEKADYSIRWLYKRRTYSSPVKNLREYQIDPYSHFASVFETAPEGELLCYQIVFAPLSDQAAVRLKKQLSDSGSDYYDDFAKKLPIWLVCITVSSTSGELTEQLAGRALESLDPADNALSIYKRRGADFNYFPPSVTPYKFSLCDTDELAGLAHFPLTELPISRLETVSMKNVLPPEAYTTGDVKVGESRARGQAFPVAIPETVRDRHVYIVGKSGTGKSTLMETIARRDIEAGRGVAVIDPHGDLVHHLLETMPEHRVQDCVLFSPKHFPVSLEILTAETENEIDLLSDDLITMFRRTSESWGDKMQAILQMAFQTLLRVPGSSFTDITRLLTDEAYRSRILSKIDHPQLAAFWQHRYDMRQAEPILIRMDRLTTSGTLRAVLTQNRGSLNFYDVITESKIFLADLSKGFLGESTSHLLGSIIVSQIQLAAMRQAHLPAEQRIPFSLFVDEVQNFTTSAFSTILSEARKQKLRLTIAHQFVSQLPTDLQKAVFGNVGTLFFFALSPDDLGAARHELGTFEPQDIANLPKYHALCRPATAARDTFSFATDPPPPKPERNFTEMIIEQTRREYGASIPATATAADAQPAQPAAVAATSGLPEGVLQQQEVVAPAITLRRPAPARPLSFATNAEKIMHFLRQAEYLSQPQIIALTELLPPNASTALKKLVDTGQIKTLDDRRPKIYFVGRTCSPTAHNLLVRDLFVKIASSRFAVRAAKFNDTLGDLSPDLSVEFVPENENGNGGGSGGSSATPLLCYFELDRGTEGVGELARKADRYARARDLAPRVGFIFERESDLLLARKTIQYPFILYATLDSFTTLKDPAFYAGPAAAGDTVQLPFFGS